MKLTYFIYLQVTIRRLIKHFTVIYADANKQFLTLNLIFFFFFLPRKNLPIWDPNLPTKNSRSPYLSPRKYHMYDGHSDTRSVQENFDLLTSFIQDSADKHIPSKTSRSVSSVPWITSEIRRKIRRRNKTHAKAKQTGSSKLRSKFETFKKRNQGWCKKTARFVCE